MTEKSLWEDTRNGIMIPPDYKLPSGNANWFWFQWFLLSLDLEIEKKQKSEKAITGSLDNDPYQIWAVFNYKDDYEDEFGGPGIPLKYHGEKGTWKLGIHDFARNLKGLYGCVYKTEKDIFIDPYPDEPTKGIAGKLRNKDQVKADCEKVKGRFIEIGPWLEWAMKKVLEDGLNGDSAKRKANPTSLENLKQYRAKSGEDRNGKKDIGEGPDKDGEET